MRVKKCKEVEEKQTEKIGYTGLDKEKRRSQKNMKKNIRQILGLYSYYCTITCYWQYGTICYHLIINDNYHILLLQLQLLLLSPQQLQHTVHILHNKTVITTTEHISTVT